MTGDAKRYVVRMGRADRSAVKVVGGLSRAKARQLANAVSYLLWYRHAFKASDVQGPRVCVEHDGFWIEVEEDYRDAME